MNRILRKDFGLAVISFALAIVVSANPAIDSLKSILNNSTGFDRIEILIELSSNYKDENIRESIRYASIATELTEDSGNIILGAKAYNNLGDYYQSIGVYDSAIVAYNRSVELYAQLRNEELSSSVISKIGELSLITGDFSMALDFMIKSLLLKENEGDLDGTGNGYLNVARVLHSINDYDQALEYYLKGLTYFEQVDNKTKIGETLWRIGLIKSLQLKIAEAEENFQQAIVHKAFRRFGINAQTIC